MGVSRRINTYAHPFNNEKKSCNITASKSATAVDVSPQPKSAFSLRGLDRIKQLLSCKKGGGGYTTRRSRQRRIQADRQASGFTNLFRTNIFKKSHVNIPSFAQGPHRKCPRQCSRPQLEHPQPGRSSEITQLAPIEKAKQAKKQTSKIKLFSCVLCASARFAAVRNFPRGMNINRSACVR